MKNKHNAKIVFFDIETAPTRAYIWGRWKQNIRQGQIHTEGYVLCFSAKKMGEKRVKSVSLPQFPIWKKDKEDDSGVVKAAWNLLNDADIVVAHNAKGFDVTTLNTRFIKLGLPPPSTYKIIDTLEIVKKKFKFPYNGLDSVCQYLGLGEKHETDFQLWIDCMYGKRQAWRTMVKYCENDVILLEELFNKVVPWADTYPNVNLYGQDNTDVYRCPKCGSTNVERRGYAFTNVGKYQRYYCKDCGAWSRERYTALDKDDRKNILTNAVCS